MKLLSFPCCSCRCVVVVVVVVVVDVDVMEGIDNSYYNSKYILGAGRANAREASF